MRFAKKSLGQNFLKDKNIIKKIIEKIKVKNKNIIEIGPGNGALTNEILNNKPKSLILIEKDNNLTNNLKLKYKNIKNIKIYNNDILDFDLKKIRFKNFIIFGNLPYNISSQILVKIIKNKKWPPNYSDIIFMFQKELGEKIIGKYKNSNYGRLSILTNFRLKTIGSFLVSRHCFFPKPKVTSMVIHFKPKENIYKINKISSLEKVTNVLFSNKRKMINKNIKKILKKEAINQIPELKLNLRPSEIKESTYYKITEFFEKN